MRVLVCGGRDYSDYRKLNDALQALHVRVRIDVLIQGGARGADTLAADWAHVAGVETLTFEADWKRHGRVAGFIRNQHMLTEGKPDLVVAFPGGKGTANMIVTARRLGVEVMEVEL